MTQNAGSNSNGGLAPQTYGGGGAASHAGYSEGGGGGSAALAYPTQGTAAVRYTEARLIEHMREVLIGIGLNVEDPSIAETPGRFIRMLREYTKPLDIEPLFKSFQTIDSGSLVTQSRIPFTMLCEHHLMPAWGHANIAYLPTKGKVIGLSKMARLVKAVCRSRPSLQESIGDQIATIMQERLEPYGVLVVIQAEHSCMACRGADTPGVVTSTSVVKGIFRNVPQARDEAFRLLGIK